MSKIDTLHIRSARVRDLSSLQSLWLTSFSSYGHSAASLERLFFDLDVTTLVCGREGQCHGAVLYRDEGTVRDVLALVVLESLRSQGIGSQLMRVCLEKGRQRGIDDFRIQTQADNVVTQKLFERLGFVATESSQTYLSGVAVVDYRLQLSPK